MRNARRHCLRTSFLLLVISACTSEGPARGTFTVRTQEVVSLDQVVGHPQWVQQQVHRVEGAVWTFYPDGTFEFNLPTALDGLYPIRGTYQQIGNEYAFSAHARYSMSAGSGRADITGRMYQANGAWHIKMTQSDAIIAAAVVYGRGYGSSAANTYEYTLRVAQIGD